MPALPEPVFPTPGLKTIVIDPGHGGEEAGAKGAKGTLEKAVTLSVARRLQIGARGAPRRARAAHARQRWRGRPDERAAVANNNKADLFISLHANASLRKARAARRCSI